MNIFTLGFLVGGMLGFGLGIALTFIPGMCL